ncbi:hypothetical protein ACOMHN_043692 [Nucella lapillus]
MTMTIHAQKSTEERTEGGNDAVNLGQRAGMTQSISPSFFLHINLPINLHSGFWTHCANFLLHGYNGLATFQYLKHSLGVANMSCQRGVVLCTALSKVRATELSGSVRYPCNPFKPPRYILRFKS